MTTVDVLIRASVGGSIAAALAWVLCQSVPRLPASARCLLWWCVAVKFLVALVWTTPWQVAVLPADRTLPAVQSNETLVAQPVILASATDSTLTTSRTAPGLAWGDVMIAVWVALTIIAVAAGIGRWRRALSSAGQSTVAPLEIQQVAARLSSVFGLASLPAVRLSDDISTPFIVWRGRHIVVIPARHLARWSSAQVEMALAHEFAHIRRRDLWLGCVPALTERLFFFHPLAHLAAREYALWREAACDAMAIRTLGTAPSDYARLLIDMGIAGPAAAIAPAGASRSFSMLKRRLIMLSHPPTSPSRLALALTTVVVLAAVAPLQLVARPSDSGAPISAVVSGGDESLDPSESVSGRSTPTPVPTAGATTTPAQSRSSGRGATGIEVRAASPVIQASASATTTGQITGNVIDPDGLAAPGADVSVEADGIERWAKTTGAGRYRFVGVRPGPVRLSFAAPGFKRQSVNSIVTTDRREITVDAMLELGGTAVQVKAMQPDATGLSTETVLLDQITRNPQDAPAHFDLANRYYQEERFADTTRLVTRAVAVIHSQNRSQGPRGPLPSLPVLWPAGAPVRVGGHAVPPTLIRTVAPIYPSATSARQPGDRAPGGHVIVEAVISAIGTVERARVVESDPAFDQSALLAVRQWLFTPARLNGSPVEVALTADLQFP